MFTILINKFKQKITSKEKKPLIDYYHRVKSIIIDKEKKVVIKNYFSLSSLNIASYIFPLITVPYLVRVLGVEKFGLISFAQSLMQYFEVFVTYGFDLTATQKISIARAQNDHKKVIQIYNSVNSTRLLLMIIGFIIVIVLVNSISIFSINNLLYIYSFGIVLSSFLLPIWFFQGVQDMQYITIMQIISRLIFTICIFIFVRTGNDYLMVPVINSIGGIVSGVITYIILIKKFNINFYLVSFKDIYNELIDGKELFLSRASITLYTASNTIVLGLFTNNTIVGYYSGADKIINVVKNITGPITQSLFPYVNKKVSESKQQALLLIKKLIPVVTLFSGVISLFLFIFAKFVVNIILGSDFNQSILVLRILAFTPLIISLSGILGSQTLIPFGYKKQISQISLTAGLLNILILILLIPVLKEVGVALAVLFIELYILVTYYIVLIRNKIKVI